ncbi:MAG TPA: ferritin-like domain-containing protein [Chthoniobacterales bacterium]|nr:ferritin-like domain-containing protein [Chthoniobacterales bacterium]
MSMKLDSLRTLWVEEMRDLYNAENQLLKALPKMAKTASTPELKEAFETHLEETRTHVERLDEIFDKLGKKPTGKTCKAMKGLVEEGSEMMQEDGPDSVIDAGIIAAAQRIEHYEIAGYGTARTFASILGEDEAEDLLQETLDEEGAADEKLTEIAESVVNEDAEDEEEAPVKASRTKASARR